MSSAIWVIVSIASIVFLVGTLITMFLAFITGDNLVTILFVVCLIITIICFAVPEKVVSETSYVVNAEVTHMDQVKDKYNRSNTMSFVSDNGEVSGVLTISDNDYAVYQVGDSVIIEVTDCAKRNGDTVQEFELIQNYN